MNHIIDQTEIQKDIFEVTVEFNKLNIDKNEIELTLGYTNKLIPQHFSSMVDDILKELPARCKIKTGYRILGTKTATDRNDGLFINEVFFKFDKIVTGQIKKSEKAALFVATIGAEMEKWSKQLLVEGDTVMGYLVDIIASITVENVTNYLHDYIGREMNKNEFNITNRYSPGYCNWLVSEQQLLFSLLPSNFCGISLTQSSLMIPIKSV